MDRTSAGSFRVVGRGMSPKVAAFRRGFATNLHALGVDDKTIQILGHSNVSLTQNIYIKSVMESQVSAMDSLSEKLGICNDLATPAKGPVN